MKNRIDALFANKRENILSVFYTAGYPKLEDTTTIAVHLDRAGVDLIEIGVPFSDPLADGPVIQKSNMVALENGMCLKLLFAQVQELRKHSEIPVVLMGYLNPVMQFREAQFVAKCREVGVDGFIIPDMPLDYYETYFKESCERKNVHAIMLIDEQTSEERIAKINQESKGFLYAVSSKGITGSSRNLDARKPYFVKLQNLNLKNPVLVGFGIQNAASFDTVCRYTQGGIIGSSFIRQLSERGVSAEVIEDFVHAIRGRN